MADPLDYLDAAKAAQITEILETFTFDELMGVFVIAFALRAQKRDWYDEPFDGEDDSDREGDEPSDLQCLPLPEDFDD